MKVSIWNIYKIFVKIGIILIGGGFIILPLLKDEMVNNLGWITDDELIDYFALSQTLPGLITTNIAIFIGYKLRGKLGAFVSLLGVSTGPFICIAIITPIIISMATSHIMKSIFNCVDIGIIILILASIKEMWAKSIVDKFSFILFVGLLLAILKFNIRPEIIILFSLIIGMSYKILLKKLKGENSL